MLHDERVPNGDGIPTDMPDNSSNAPEATVRISRDYVDWAVKGTLGGLCTGMFAIALWGFNTEYRVGNGEEFTSRIEERVATLEGKNAGMYKLAEDIAVLKAKLDSQDKQLDRIEKLLAVSR